MTDTHIVRAVPKKEDYKVVELYAKKSDNPCPWWQRIGLYDCEQTLRLVMNPHVPDLTGQVWKEGATIYGKNCWEFYWLYSIVTCTAPGIHVSTVDTD